MTPTLLRKRIIFDTSQNAIWSHVLHAVFLFRQFSPWVTQTFGFLIQELTDQAQDPGKFVPTVYLSCCCLIFWNVLADFCCISAYSVGLQASTESYKNSIWRTRGFSDRLYLTFSFFAASRIYKRIFCLNRPLWAKKFWNYLRVRNMISFRLNVWFQVLLKLSGEFVGSFSFFP